MTNIQKQIMIRSYNHFSITPIKIAMQVKNENLDEKIGNKRKHSEVMNENTEYNLSKRSKKVSSQS
jgi:hypothetical protein